MELPQLGRRRLRPSPCGRKSRVGGICQIGTWCLAGVWRLGTRAWAESGCLAGSSTTPAWRWQQMGQVPVSPQRLELSRNPRQFSSLALGGQSCEGRRGVVAVAECEGAGV